MLFIFLLALAVQIAGGGAALHRSGLPLVPLGFYSSERVSADASSVRAFSHGLNVAMQQLGWRPHEYPSRSASLATIHQWLDRADAVGASVLYDLSQLARPSAGYPNPGAIGIPNATCCADIFALIRAEVAAVARHPSIVGWYIADEPDGGMVKGQAERVAVMAKVRALVREADAAAGPRPTVACLSSTPWYVGSNWGAFLNVTDEVWVDLYEDPPGSARTWNATKFPQSLADHGWATPAALDAITRAVAPRRVTLVLRITGGIEDFERSPSPRELRAATYLGWVHGSVGAAYFERSAQTDSLYGRVPASASVWDACARLAVEGAQLGPALLGGRDTARFAVTTSGDDRVHAAVFLEPARRGPLGEACGAALVVLAVNLVNEPIPAVTLTLESGDAGSRYNFSEATVLFNALHRTVPIARISIASWTFGEPWDAYGTRAYRIELPAPTTRATVNSQNVIHNPSFELASGGDVPDGFQVVMGNDTGASLALESRDSVHGRHSLRLTTPTRGQGLMAVAMPTTLEPHTGLPSPFFNTSVPWTLSVWARGVAVNAATGGPRLQVGVLYWAEEPWLPSQGKNITCGIPDPSGPKGWGGNPCVNVSLTREWALYELHVGVPSRHVSTTRADSWIYWELIGAGTAWLDLIQLVPTKEKK